MWWSMWLINYLNVVIEGKVVEVWTIKVINYLNSCIFVCPSHVNIHSDEGSKFDSKLKGCILLGYINIVKRYKLLNPIAKKIMIKIDIIFNETFIMKYFDHEEVKQLENVNSNKKCIQVKVQEIFNSPKIIDRNDSIEKGVDGMLVGRLDIQ